MRRFGGTASLPRVEKRSSAPSLLRALSTKRLAKRFEIRPAKLELREDEAPDHARVCSVFTTERQERLDADSSSLKVSLGDHLVESLHVVVGVHRQPLSCSTQRLPPKPAAPD